MTGQTPTPVLKQRLTDLERQIVTLQRTHAHVQRTLDLRRVDQRRRVATVPTQRPHPEAPNAVRVEVAQAWPAPRLPDPVPEWAIVAHRNRIALDSLGTSHVLHAETRRVA